MTPPRVLLVTGTLPSGSDVGGLILRDLVRLYPRRGLSCFGLLQATATRASTDPDWLPRQVVTLPRSFSPEWRRGLPGRVLTHARFQAARLHQATLLRQAVVFARTHGVDLIWAILDQPVIYRVAPALADHLNVPLVATVWDPPESVCINADLDRLSTAVAVRDFHRALSRATRCAVMTEAMACEYGGRHRLQTVIMRHAIDPQERLAPACRPNSHGPFTIGFCGSLYAVREFRALLAALDAVGWQVAGRAVRIRALTGALSGKIGPHAAIEWLGWRSQRETIRLLGESDVNYLPYWFDQRRRTAARLCFPSKLTTYLAAGRPVVFHGPAEAAPAEFMRRHCIGVCCHSPAAATLVGVLTHLATNADAYRRAAEAIANVRAREFSGTKLRARFAALLGIAEKSLAAGAATGAASEPAGLPASATPLPQSTGPASRAALSANRSSAECDWHCARSKHSECAR